MSRNTKIVRRGRTRFRTGRIRNPVLVLTGKELFSQFSFRRDFYAIYGERAQYAHHAYIRRDIEELCDFSQQVHLGIESYHDWLRKKRKKKDSKRALDSDEP